MFKQYWENFKDNSILYTSVFFYILLALNILDVILTWYGVVYLGAFGEGNCIFKEHIESGDMLVPIGYKIFFVGLLFIVMKVLHNYPYKTEKHRIGNHLIAMIGLVFVTGVYLYTILHWIVLLSFYHLN